MLSSVRARLSKTGLTSPVNTSPRELVVIVVNHFGESAKPLAAWLIQMEEIRYRKNTDDTNISKLKSKLQTLSWPVK
jgi:hypothetical protein